MARWALVFLVSLQALPAVADEVQNERSIFFGGTLGPGYAWFEHPGVSFGQLGAEWDMILGGNVTKNLALEIVFTTWQFTRLGTPAHLHTFAPRIEWMPAKREGLHVSVDAGLGVIDGDLPKSKGGEASLAVSYHKNVNHWVTAAIETGVHYHFYTDGKNTIQPFVSFQLRLHGLRE